MKQEEWNKRLRDRLADHQEPVSDDLWSRIEASLPPQRRQKRRIIPILRWAVAASFLALLLGGTYLMFQKNDPSIAQKVDATMPQEPHTQPQKYDDKQTKSPNIAKKVMAKATLSSDDTKKTYPPQSNDYQEIAECNDNITNKEHADNADQDTPNPPINPITPNNPINPNSPINPLPPTPHPAATSRQIAVNLYASNNILQMNGHDPIALGGEMAQAYYDADASLNHNQGRRLAPIYLSNYQESKKHYLPFALGLTANYPITDRFSVSTGVVYTRLRSDFTYSMNDNHIKKQQVLQYLGIPLSLHYHCWKYKNFQTYLSFGMQIDWNIKAELKTDNTLSTIDKDHCQWSVNGNVGLQYGIIPQLSLYTEPGVKYYFDNHSKIDNIFKDKPTQFNIELGLRLHLPK